MRIDVESIPADAAFVLSALSSAGYGAYIVGGWVRDRLLGNPGGDIDIATAAEPWQVKKLFGEDNVIPTGEKHGTVTVLHDENSFEVTTFRRDVGYSDLRRPDEVIFVPTLEEDLARRDFTVNAIACDISGNITDPFGGCADLDNRVISAVGDPEERFSEDALRIMRALRFSSVLDFEIEESTAAAARKLKYLISDSCVSPERCFSELVKLLCGSGAGRIITGFSEILGEVIPELLPMVDFDQKNKYHAYDLLTHTAKVVDGVPQEKNLRLAALLHDVAKPNCFTEDEAGGHFYGHERAGAEKTCEILSRLRADRATTERVTALVREHGLVLLENEAFLRRALNRYGEEMTLELIKLSHSDNSALSDLCADRPERIERISAMTERLIAERSCFSLSDLAVKGDDLIALGMERGPRLGIILKLLLGEVMDGNLENRREAILEEAKKYI